MFDSIAGDYDSLNHILSLDVDKIWRKKALKRIVDVPSPLQVLDLACGTGDFSIAIAKALGRSFRQAQRPPACAATGSAVPTTEPAVPATGPAVPTTEPAFPVTEPAVPTTEPAFPVTEPAFPVTEPAFPVTEPAFPVTEPAFPVTEPAFPVTEPAFPVTEPAEVTNASTSSTTEKSSPATVNKSPATGSSTETAESHVTGVDLSEGMLAVMREKVEKAGLTELISIEEGDGEELRFPDDTFDRVTIAFGIRNFEDRPKGLREMLRVLKPGGRLVILELSRPENPVIRWFYDLYFLHILPKIGGKVSGDKAAYAYLPASVAAFPGKKAFMATMREAGFRTVTHKAFTLGVCRMYTGEK